MVQGERQIVHYQVDISVRQETIAIQVQHRELVSDFSLLQIG